LKIPCVQFHKTLYRALLSKFILCVMSGFRGEVDENCDLLGYYAASSGNSLPTFRDSLSIPSSRVKKSGTHMLSRKVGKELPLLAA
jgi:hypothetical protein